MNQLTQVPHRCNLRAFIAALITYVMLVGQMAPLALAASPARAVPPSESALPTSVSFSQRPVPAPLPPGGGVPLVVPTPIITATKTDSFPDSNADGKADPGETITYTVTISNTGTADATGVQFSDSVDNNTTLVASSGTLAADDDYNTIGNVQISVPTPGLLANDLDVDAASNTGMTASGGTTSTQGGTVTINPNGSFTYDPPVGFTGTDTFTYTATTSGGKTAQATARIAVAGKIWFVNNNGGACSSTCNGRLSHPFTSLANFQAVNDGGANHPATGDNIFLYESSTNYVGPTTLLNTQKFIGQDATASLITITGLTQPSGTDPLPAMNTGNPTVNIISGGNAINLGQGNLLRGFTVGSTTGAKISGNTFGTLTVGNSASPDVTLNGNGQALNLTTGTLSVAGGFASVTTTASSGQGINLSGVADSDGAGGSSFSFGSTSVSGSTTQGILIGTTTADINFGNTSVTGGTDGVSLQNNSSGTRTFGTLGVSGGSGIAFLHGAGGGNVTVTGAATLSSAGNAIDIQNAAASTAINFQSSVSATRTASGGTGVNLASNNATSTITFNSLSITTNAGTGLSATGGGTVNVTNNTGAINSTPQAAPAIIGNGVTLNANFSSIASSGGTNGVSLTNVAGTLNFGSGSLTGASGTEFFVSGSNPTISYSGTITQNNAARVVDIQGTTGNTITLSGTVTGGALSTGVHIGDTTAVNGNVSFTTLTLGTSGSRIGSQAVTISGGTGTYTLGTVSIFTNNQTGIGATNADGTINITTGTVDAGQGSAVNISGPAGLTTLGVSLTSITSNGGSNNGLSLVNTNGTFTVTGSGGTCANGNTAGCTGGTLANKTGADASTTQGVGVFLNNATGVSLTRIFLHDFSNFAILGNAVSGFTLGTSVINGANGSNTAPVQPAGFAVSIDGEASIGFSQLTGSDSITNTFVSGGVNDNIAVLNNSGTLNFLNMTGDTIRDNNATTGNDGLHVEALATATMTVKVGSVGNGNTFAANRGDHIEFTTQNTTATGTIVFIGNTLTGGHPNGLGQGITVQGIGTTNYNVSNNSVNGSIGVAINCTMLTGGSQTFSGTIANNTVGTTGVAGSGSLQGFDVVVELNGLGTHNATVSGNTLRQWSGANAINITKRNATGASGTLNVTVTGNTLAEPNGVGPINGLLVNSGTATNDAGTTCADIGGAGALGNTMAGSGANGGTDFRVRQRFNTTVRLPGYGGANTDDAAVVAFIQARNTGGETGSATHDTVNGGGFVGGAICTAGAAPTLPDLITPTSGGPPSSGSVAPSEQPTSARTSGVTSRAFVSPMVRTAAPAVVSRTLVPSSSGVTANRTSPTRSTTPVVRIVPGPQSGGTVSANIGTIHPGDSVQITFQVTVNNPYSGGPNVSNQGTVSGSNFSNVLTDDPSVGGTADPTLTPINVTNIAAQDAQGNEPSSGTSPMLFTVTLSSPASGGGVSVNYATADQSPGAGHATGGATCDGTADYQTTNGTVNFASGERVKTITVNICADSVAGEPDETFLLNLSGATGGTITDAQAVGTIKQGNAAGTFIISELRTSGPGGLGDDFVELYNNTDTPLTVTASDASAGFGLFKQGTDCNATPVLIGTIPNGTIIPARGHFLFVGSQYGLGSYATGDQTMTADIESDKNVAIFKTADVNNLSTVNRLDAVGFDSNTGGGVCDLLREANTLPPVSGSTTQYSFFRKECDFVSGVGCTVSGTPKDTNDNSADFKFADTQGTFISGVTQQLGAPGPENKTSSIRRDSTILVSLLDNTKSSSVSPNRVRDLTQDPANNSTFGTLSIRRRVTNNTGANVTRIRFRIVEVTTFPSPGGGVADLRARTSTNTSASGITDAGTCSPSATPCTVTVLGTTLEQPPNQPNGGGINSTLAVGTVTVGTPLAPGAAVNVQFLLGVQTTGTFRFLIITEALP